MKIYLAGIYTSNFNIDSRIFYRLNEVEQASIERIENYLESYHYICGQNFVNKIRATGKKVFLDSGAFSASTKGVDVNLKDYCDYCKENADIILTEDGVSLVSVLDAIGDPLQTWKNQKRMEAHGVTPLPCFHFGDDERYLEDYVKRYPYITIGGMVAVHKRDLKIWLDRIWEKYLTDGAGRARLKVHGFGLTTESLLERYPWYSVDSSTWIQAAWSGDLLATGLPRISVSSNSPSLKVPNQHYQNMSAPYKRKIEAMVSSRGYDLKRLADFPYARWSYNIEIMNEFNDTYKDKEVKFFNEQKGLF